MPTGRQAQPVPNGCPDSLLLTAFDVALDAKNSPSGSAMVVNRLPLALQGFHSGFFEAFAVPACPRRPPGRNIPVSIFSFVQIGSGRGQSLPLDRQVSDVWFSSSYRIGKKEKAPQLLATVRGRVRQLDRFLRNQPLPIGQMLHAQSSRCNPLPLVVAVHGAY